MTSGAAMCLGRLARSRAAALRSLIRTPPAMQGRTACVVGMITVARRPSARTTPAVSDRIRPAARVACPHAAFAFALALAAPFAPAACAQSPEPPPEAEPGDWSVERADSLAPGWTETTFDSRGKRGSAPSTGERMRFRSGESAGSLRGGGEALPGARLEAPLAAGTLRAGRLGPRWGRGLLLGAAAQPWAVQADDRGDDAPLLGHAGDGAQWRMRDGGLELLAGRFSRRTLFGARVRRGPVALAALGDDADAQASVALERGAMAVEWAANRAGRWRAEFSARRATARTTTVLRARGGLATFRSLAEPARAGPPHVLAVGETARRGAGTLRACAALWAFASGACGAATTLEVERRLVHHAAVAVGFEEQHGTRRDPALASAPAADTPMRQGWWCEWRGRAGGRTLDLRHELRGGRAFARGTVRRAVIAQGESALPAGGSLAVMHSAWSTRAGESLWISESDGDLLTLRAASGAGQRTQVVLALPFVGGRARATVHWTTAASQRAVPGWALEWTRRMRQ